LTGDVAIRVREIMRQIAMEHELDIISDKVTHDTAGVSTPAKEILGLAL
jgi:hypothetical protein